MVDNELLFSPLDVRYRKDLPATLSEQASVAAQVKVETAWLLTLMEEGLCPRVEASVLESLLAGLSFAEIEAIEARTQHATRALVEALSERFRKAASSQGRPELAQLAEWVHVGLTSFDTVDTAQRLRVRYFFESDYWPQLNALKAELRRLAIQEKDTVSVGRTHGQWAVPTLFGLQFAEAHERLVLCEGRLRDSLDRLTGQASGAIGGYHAPALLVKNPLETERRFLARLQLQPHYASTQILPPEDLVAVAQNFFNLSSVLAKLATDYRHLARSEIGEVAEGFSAGQVGSSTMPQKRNPWNLEHVCSLYKVLQSRLLLVELDLVSEHHRDLTNSASGRFHLEVFAVGHLMARRMTRILSKLEVVHSHIERNRRGAGSSVLAEALYVLGSKAGVAHAHDRVREAARRSESEGISLLEAVQKEGWLPREVTAESLEREVLSGSRQKFAAISAQWKET